MRVNLPSGAHPDPSRCCSTTSAFVSQFQDLLICSPCQLWKSLTVPVQGDPEGDEPLPDGGHPVRGDQPALRARRVHQAEDLHRGGQLERLHGSGTQVVSVCIFLSSVIKSTVVYMV